MLFVDQQETPVIPVKHHIFRGNPLRRSRLLWRTVIFLQNFVRCVFVHIFHMLQFYILITVHHIGIIQYSLRRRQSFLCGNLHCRFFLLDESGSVPGHRLTCQAGRFHILKNRKRKTAAENKKKEYGKKAGVPFPIGFQSIQQSVINKGCHKKRLQNPFHMLFFSSRIRLFFCWMFHTVSSLLRLSY